MKHCLVFASLISPSKMILFEKKYQTFDTVFHHQMKHLEVRQKYSAARRIFNSLLGVSSGDETLHLMFDILLKQFPPAEFGICNIYLLIADKNRRRVELSISVLLQTLGKLKSLQGTELSAVIVICSLESF